MPDKQLDSCIRYLGNRWTAAMMLGSPSDQTLLKLSLKYLEELKTIKDQEVVSNEMSDRPG